MSDKNLDSKEKLLKLLQNAIDQDNKLREEYKIGEKFRFIRDRLQALFTRVDDNIKALQKEKESKITRLGEEETLVYVHLFNAQGMVLQTWQKFLNPGVFYEYSVNRPIYADKSHIETFIKNKSNKSQHGYITVAVNKNELILPATGEKAIEQGAGELIKVKEGSLRMEKLQNFTHNGNVYKLEADGSLKKTNFND